MDHSLWNAFFWPQSFIYIFLAVSRGFRNFYEPQKQRATVGLSQRRKLKISTRVFDFKTRCEKSEFAVSFLCLVPACMFRYFFELNFSLIAFFSFILPSFYFPSPREPSRSVMKDFLNAFFALHFQREKQCMKWMGKMQFRFRCIIKQFTYLNSFSLVFLFTFFSIFFPPLLVLSINLFQLCCYSFSWMREEKFKKKSNEKRYKNSSVFWLNSIKKRVLFRDFSRGFHFISCIQVFL
jgi:hypothetical protein